MSKASLPPASVSSPKARRGGHLAEGGRAAGRGRARADPTRLKQILLNLLSNAVKFTPAGAVTLTTGTIRWRFFKVADTGIGMSKENMAKALLPFQQIDNSLARRYEGTGLGLTLTKSLAELHGGTLTLESASVGEPRSPFPFPPGGLRGMPPSLGEPA